MDKFEIAGLQNEELERNLSTLFSTRAGSQPGERDFGISWGCLDEVPEIAETLFFAEAVKKVKAYEPRVEIIDILFNWDSGTAVPRIIFGQKAVRSGR